MEVFTLHRALGITRSKFWSEAYCRIPTYFQDFILGASPLYEIFGVEILFVMVFSDACEDVLNRVVDQATYSSILVICIQRTFLPLERHCACEGGTSSYFDAHSYSYFLLQTKLMRFWPYPCLAGLAYLTFIVLSGMLQTWPYLFIFGLALPPIMELGRLSFAIHLPMKLTLSPFGVVARIWLYCSFCLQDLSYLYMLFPMDLALSSLGVTRSILGSKLSMDLTLSPFHETFLSRLLSWKRSNTSSLGVAY